MSEDSLSDEEELPQSRYEREENYVEPQDIAIEVFLLHKLKNPYFKSYIIDIIYHSSFFLFSLNQVLFQDYNNVSHLKLISFVYLI